MIKAFYLFCVLFTGPNEKRLPNSPSYCITVSELMHMFNIVSYAC